MTEAALAGGALGRAGMAALVPALAVCGFVPGWAVAGALGVRDGFARTGAAVLLSALVTFVAGAASLAVTRGVAPAATGLTVVTAGLAAAVLFARRPGRGAFPFRPSWSAAAVAAFALLVLGVYALNPGLRFRVDGWFHGAVTARVLAVGLPPDDPYFAGIPLRYPWAWHVVLATTAQAGSRLGVTPFDAMAGWSALAALATGAWLVVLGRAWAAGQGLDRALADRCGAAAVAVAVLGANPFGALIWLGRGVFGHEGGAAELVRPLTGGASEAMLGTTWHYPHVSLASLLDKYLTPTAFGLGEASVLAFAAFALFPPPGAGRRWFVLVVLAALGALLVHAAAGLAVLLLVVAALAVAGLAPGASARRPAFAVAAAFALALGLAAPYLLVTSGASGAGRFAPAVRGDMLLAIGLVGAVVLPLAAREAVRVARGSVVARTWFLFAALLLALAATVQLMQRNETKLVNLALLALSVPAAATLVRLRPALAVGLLVCLVPTHAIAVGGFLMDRGQETPGRPVPPPLLADAYAWIGRSTRPGDAFLEAVPPGAGDPDRDLVVHGPRALVWGGLGYASNWGYPAAELAWRRRAAGELAADTLGAGSLAALRAFAADGGRTVYAVRRGSARASLDRLRPAAESAWTRVFANDSLALDRLDAAAGARP